mmetsp:Transcript_6387/g.8452  ORF Transcript_6387/g.8452 Transcript_6387/m.8452 type:complete len:335 (+) Transcript_6387:45-1049(+)
MESISEVAAAAAGGAFSSAALYPMEVLKNNLQAKGATSKTVRQSRDEIRHCRMKRLAPKNELGLYEDEEKNDVAIEIKESKKQMTGPCISSEISNIYNEKGLAGFYRGVQYSVLESSLDKALYFAFYSGLKRLVGGELSVSANLGLGYLAEAFRLPFSMPFEVVATKLQTSTQNETAYAIIQTILRKNGIAGFYKGWAAYTVLCLKPAIQYTVYEKLKTIYLLQESARRKQTVTELTLTQAFLLGAVSRAIATIIIFPYQRAKVLAMSSRSSEKESQSFLAMASMLYKILQEEGFGSLYQGIGPEISRGVLSAALMLATKEKIGGFVKQILLSS